MKILVRTTVGGEMITYKGTIDVNWIREPQAYVSWKVFGPNGVVAAKSENYFYKESEDSLNELMMRVKDKILGYRIGRKKAFEEIDIVDG